MTGLAFFLAHAYEVRSGLQRAADKTALYAATQVDPRLLPSTADDAWPDAAAVLSFADDAFGRDASFQYAADQVACPVSDGAPAVACVTYSPGAAPVANQHVEVEMRYRWETPFAPLLRIIGLNDALVDLTATASAALE